MHLNDIGPWGMLALVAAVACLLNVRLSPWLWLAGVGMAGVAFSAALQTTPLLPVPCGSYPANPSIPWPLWAACVNSWVGTAVGLTAALWHIRRKMNSLQR